MNVTSAKIADCAKKSKSGKDYCETAAKSAKCLLKAIGGIKNLNEKKGLGAALSALNNQSKKSGKTIVWVKPAKKNKQK